MVVLIEGTKSGLGIINSFSERQTGVICSLVLKWCFIVNRLPKCVHAINVRVTTAS